MNTKKCPSCGKKVAVKASYCIYCAARFDESESKSTSDDRTVDDVLANALSESGDTQLFEVDLLADIDAGDGDELSDTVLIGNDPTDSVSEPEAAETPAKKNRIWLILSVVAFVLIAVLVVLMLLYFKNHPRSAPIGADDQIAQTTSTTVSPERQAWLDSFVGQWVDEQSVGKKDLVHQGGQMLVISDISNHVVSFDLYSHSGGKTQKTAFVAAVKSTLFDDTLHFTFDDDALGHSGEGFLQLHEGGINAEVLIKNINPDEHSLAMNTVFMRQELPTSDGIDIAQLTTKESLSVFGEEKTQAVVNSEDQSVTYEYEAGFAVVEADGRVRSITIGYDRTDNPSEYCYDSVDGTATYDTVKAYFGEAEQDYEELDTKIFVLHYPLSDTSSVTFTFNAENGLLKTIGYIF